MVLRWGMSDKVGNIDYSEAHEGYSGNTAGLSVSANTKEIIEDEVQQFIATAYEPAHAILIERKAEWARLAQRLLEYETLTGDQIKNVMRGDPPEADDDAGSAAGGEKPASITDMPKTERSVRPAAVGCMVLAATERGQAERLFATWSLGVGCM